MNNIAIIPARGGSKGVPRKNIRILNGKPLIVWSIEQALSSSLIDDVYVSSDCDDILRISSDCGAKTINRPSDLSSDEASSESAWLHACEYLKDIDSENDRIIGIQATSPLRHATDFDEAIELYHEKKLDTLFSSNSVEDHHLWQVSEGNMNSINYDFRNRKRRQKMTEKYLENGSFYIFTALGLKRNQNRLHGKIGTYVQEKYKSAQIDELVDFDICSALMTKFLNV